MTLPKRLLSPVDNAPNHGSNHHLVLNIPFTLPCTEIWFCCLNINLKTVLLFFHLYIYLFLFIFHQIYEIYYHCIKKHISSSYILSLIYQFYFLSCKTFVNFKISYIQDTLLASFILSHQLLPTHIFLN